MRATSSHSKKPDHVNEADIGRSPQGYLAKELLLNDDKQLAAAQHLRYRVFVERRGWVKLNQQNVLQDIDAYDAKSHHFAVIDRLDETVGTIRLLRGGESNFMLDKEFAILMDGDAYKIGHSQEYAELSRLAVKPELSAKDRHEVAMCLYRAAYGWSTREGMSCWYVVVESSFLKVLERLGFPFHRIGRKYRFQPHVTTVVASLDLAEAAQALGSINPGRLAWFQQNTLSGQ